MALPEVPRVLALSKMRRLCVGLFLLGAVALALVPSFANVRALGRPASNGAAVSLDPRDSRLGVSLPNLGSPFTGPLFKDAMKQATPWSSSSALHVDAFGNILSLARGQVADTTIFASAAYPSGDYTLLYDGSGTLAVAGATTLEARPGRAIIRITARRGGIHLRLSATALNDPVRNIRLVLPGYESTYALQPFLPNAITALRQFHVLRFEQWSRVATDTDVEPWPFRAKSSNFTQAGAAGVAPEYAIALANVTGDDPWFVLPVGATDAYATHLAQLVGATLDPRLHPIFQFAGDPLALGSATSAYETIAGLAERRSNDPRLAAVLWHAARSAEVLDTITLASSSVSVRPVRVIGLPSGASPGAFEARAALGLLALGAGHADAVALGAALAGGNLFAPIAATAARSRLSVFGSDFELQPALLVSSTNARTLYGAALERWHAGGGALASVPSDATNALWAGARDYMARHPYPHPALAPIARVAESASSRLVSEAVIPAVAQSGVYINVGGPAVGSFTADPSTQHGTSIETTRHAIEASGVTNPAPAAIYQTARVGCRNLTYTIGGLAPGSTYNVRLDFAELSFTKAGQRVFNILINGTTVQSHYDIVGAAGAPFTATAVSATPVASASGQITITLNATVNSALLSGIEIVATGSAPTPMPTIAPGIDINVGGPAVGNFVADTNPYQSGTSTESTTAAIDTSRVPSPAPIAVYQTARVGGPNLLYNVAALTPGAAYGVRLDFAEQTYTKKNSRVFNIFVNATKVKSNYDIACVTGGRFRASAVSTVAIANGSGQIVIDLKAYINNALLSGIEVTPVAFATPTPTPTPSPTTTPTPTPTPTPTATPSPTPTPTPPPSPTPTPTPSPTPTPTAAPIGAVLGTNALVLNPPPPVPAPTGTQIDEILSGTPPIGYVQQLASQLTVANAQPTNVAILGVVTSVSGNNLTVTQTSLTTSANGTPLFFNQLPAIGQPGSNVIIETSSATDDEIPGGVAAVQVGSAIVAGGTAAGNVLTAAFLTSIPQVSAVSAMRNRARVMQQSLHAANRLRKTQDTATVGTSATIALQNEYGVLASSFTTPQFVIAPLGKCDALIATYQEVAGAGLRTNFGYTINASEVSPPLAVNQSGSVNFTDVPASGTASNPTFATGLGLAAGVKISVKNCQGEQWTLYSGILGLESGGIGFGSATTAAPPLPQQSIDVPSTVCLAADLKLVLPEAYDIIGIFFHDTGLEFCQTATLTGAPLNIDISSGSNVSVPNSPLSLYGDQIGLNVGVTPTGPQFTLLGSNPQSSPSFVLGAKVKCNLLGFEICDSAPIALNAPQTINAQGSGLGLTPPPPQATFALPAGSLVATPLTVNVSPNQTASISIVSNIPPPYYIFPNQGAISCNPFSGSIFTDVEPRYLNPSLYETYNQIGASVTFTTVSVHTWPIQCSYPVLISADPLGQTGPSATITVTESAGPNPNQIDWDCTETGGQAGPGYTPGTWSCPPYPPPLPTGDVSRKRGSALIRERNAHGAKARV